jgi:transposase
VSNLILIEKKIKHLDSEGIYQARQKQAKPILNKLRVWLDKTIKHVPPKSALGKALTYMDNQWDRLIRYAEYGDGVIDNNPAENAIRPFVIGRKNWLFSNSVTGAKASANLYSIIETAKANQVEPFIYFQHIFTQLPLAESVRDLENLLPWKIKLS